LFNNKVNNKRFRFMHIILHPPPSFSMKERDRRGRDRMVVGFITTYVISAYHH